LGRLEGESNRMTEKLIVEKFSALGYISKSNELYLPIENVKQLTEECQKQKVSIIGVEFFHKDGEEIIPVDPINGIDCSVLLSKYSRWDDVVDLCCNVVKNILKEEEHRDKTQWCNLTLLDQRDWKRQR